MSLAFGISALLGLLIVPAGAHAFRWEAASGPGAAASMQLTSAAVATHSTKGVVKAIDDHTLVITRSARRGKEITFTLDRSTRREGEVEIGRIVEVRYRTEASRRVAAVVSVQDNKRQ